MNKCYVNTEEAQSLCRPYLYAGIQALSGQDSFARNNLRKAVISTMHAVSLVSPIFYSHCLNLDEFPKLGLKTEVKMIFANKAYSVLYSRRQIVEIKEFNGFIVLGMSFIKSAMLHVDGVRYNSEINW